MINGIGTNLENAMQKIVRDFEIQIDSPIQARHCEKEKNLSSRFCFSGVKMEKKEKIDNYLYHVTDS